MSNKNETYEQFVEKFKPKLTTDDCYTPEPVYNAVRDWTVQHYHLQGRPIVRPFYPGGDFEHYNYPPDCVVIDNPPFSIYAKIVRFYLAHDIRFLLFAPGLTQVVSGVEGVCYLATGIKVTYENGAVVNTSFTTNLEPDKVIWTAPDLARAVEEAVQANKQLRQAKKQRRIALPGNVITSARLSTIAKRHIDFSVDATNARPIRKIGNYQLFGAGFVISPKAAAEKAAAEKAAAEKAAAEKAAAEKAAAEKVTVVEFPPGEGWIE